MGHHVFICLCFVLFGHSSSSAMKSALPSKLRFSIVLAIVLQCCFILLAALNHIHNVIIIFIKRMNVVVVGKDCEKRKTVQIKYNNNLYNFQLHFIINFVPTEPKLAHSLVKFPAHSISQFPVNIIMAKTGSTAKVNSAKRHSFSNPPKFPYFLCVFIPSYMWVVGGSR